ncbi:MAG: hypothetical protein JKY84_09105 [Emcibacteraceae bacterium]|nr:hypothetical protein [Emcibacteraceae bacterium]
MTRRAGRLPKSVYVRQIIFGDQVSYRKPKTQKKKRQPKMDSIVVARLLTTFGESEIATSMLALSLAAQAGTLDVTSDVQSDIRGACLEINTICKTLVYLSGLERQDGL